MFDTWTMLRNWVHRGGPWTGSKEVVHGPGPKGWSMDLGSMFCIRPNKGIVVDLKAIANFRWFNCKWLMQAVDNCSCKPSATNVKPYQCIGRKFPLLSPSRIGM